MEKTCLLGCFDRRGWERCPDGEADWNVYWANVHSVKQLFSADNVFRLRDDQLINHFSNHYELTRKDLLVKNIKRYRKELMANGAGPGACGFLPPTYVLPTDYSLFVEEFRRQPSSMWIMKPTSKARGIGIFLVTKLSQVRKWASKSSDVYVISRYIERPLLIGGRKFDLRLYVLVTQYRPLQAYLYGDGFARFCNEKYSAAASERDNHYVHLTNVAVQKHNEDYNEHHGGKWDLANLMLWLEARYGAAATRRMFDEVKDAILHSIRAVQGVMMNDKHCFECYGYDMLIDENLKPWLLEVNASPALAATTKSDRKLKHSLLHNIFNILLPEDMPEDPRERQEAFKERVQAANFVTLCDEDPGPAPPSAPPQSASEGRKWR